MTEVRVHLEGGKVAAQHCTGSQHCIHPAVQLRGRHVANEGGRVPYDIQKPNHVHRPIGSCRSEIKSPGRLDAPASCMFVHAQKAGKGAAGIPCHPTTVTATCKSQPCTPAHPTAGCARGGLPLPPPLARGSATRSTSALTPACDSSHSHTRCAWLSLRGPGGAGRGARAARVSTVFAETCMHACS